MNEAPSPLRSTEDRARIVRGRLIDLVARDLDLDRDKIADATPLSGDAVDRLFLFGSVERAFQIAIDDDEFMATRTFGDLVALVGRKR